MKQKKFDMIMAKLDSIQNQLNVIQNNNTQTITNKCSLCGIKFDNMSVGFTCMNSRCPTFIKSYNISSTTSMTNPGNLDYEI
jgi:predicted Zn-ribbon and HTH transcriptional regulator